MLNLVFRTPVEKGGCGMPPDRVRPSGTTGKGSPKSPVPVAGRPATGGSSLNLRDSKAVYAAILVIMDGDNLAVAKWAEELHDLALKGAALLGKAPAPAPAPAK